MRGRGTVILLMATALAIACRDHRDDCRELFNRQMDFPEEFKTQLSQSADSLVIVSLVDTAGCVPCRLKLAGWNGFLFEMEKTYGLTPSLHFIVNSGDSSYIDYLKKMVGKATVYLDKDGYTLQSNRIPDDDLMRTFLLTKERRCLAIGSPVVSHKIQKLYAKAALNYLGRNISDDISGGTTLHKSLGNFHWAEIQRARFAVANNSPGIVSIDTTYTSCKCATAHVEKRTAQPNDSLVIEVEYQADEPKEFQETVYVLVSNGKTLNLTIGGRAEEK